MCASGTAAKLIATISDPTAIADRMPPRLSTGSVVSFTCAGTSLSASTNAMAASGSVTMNTEPHQKLSSSAPDTSGPSAEIAPPIADHRAIERVRAGPDHRAVMSASVVGYAMPAETPPRMRAAMRTCSFGAQAAMRHAGTESETPRISMSLRP